jgi:nicotinamidase/pyrazinamidase
MGQDLDGGDLMAGKAALVIVDVENDFTPGGALAVPDGDQVVPVLNRYAERFTAGSLPVYASRDWHPPVTKHFQQYGGIWPPHCIQGTKGAEFHHDLKLPHGVVVISKGMDPEQDSYSAFDAIGPDGTLLAESLRRDGVERVYVGGLATDYCVKWTVLEALRQGFRATFLADASLGVNLQPHDSERAIEEMVAAGADATVLERLVL